MTLPSDFQERLQQMEETRNQRLSLLQAEKELQSKKLLLLSAKLSNLRRMEQRCLLLEQKSAALSFHILAKKSEIDTLDAKYQNAVQQLRFLKAELDELERSANDKDRFYEAKALEMEKFREEVGRHVLNYRLDVQNLMDTISELKLNLQEIQNNNEFPSASEIAIEEAREKELLIIKRNLDGSLASNYQLRSLLQKQIHNILISQDQGRGNNNQIIDRRKGEIPSSQMES